MVANKDNRNEEEPDFSDSEDFFDDISNEDLLGDFMNTEPRLDKSTDKMIVIDNVPKVGQEKKDKLRQVLTKLFNKYGQIVNEYYPEEKDGVTKGYVFLEYANDQSAADAQAQLNGCVLDKNHTFKANFFSDFEKYSNLDLQNVDDKLIPYADPGSLLWWLTINECHDQFAITAGDIYTSVYLNTPIQPTILESRDKWTPTRFQWSPKGTYLATFHERGIALWAGDKFKQFMRFAHNDVQFIDFSPCEKYLVTCNPRLAGVDDQVLIIWDTRTGQKKRSFTVDRVTNLSWPYFKWNHDDSYFAKISTDALYVYETETFSLLDKKLIKIPLIRDFEWSPSSNQIAYWVSEDKNVLARVVLLDIPSKLEPRSKNLVNVAECKMYWQNNGDYVCVRVDRYRRQNVEKGQIKYSGIYHNFEIFRIRERQIPVDSIEIKEAFQAFGWEPNGQKFCIIYTEGQTRTAAFYRVVNAGAMTPGKIELIKEIKGKSFTHIFWSPQGQHCVLTAMGQKHQGICTLEFFDVTANDVQSLNKAEHDHMSDIEWDPTGRYVVSYVSCWNSKVENAYIMWNFQGRLIQKQFYDKLHKFSWRPRPAALVSEEEKKEIRKNFKTYEDKYNARDSQDQKKVSKEILEKRRSLLNEFGTFKSVCARRFDDQREIRLKLRNGYDTDKLYDDDDLTEYTVEFLVESKKEEI